MLSLIYAAVFHFIFIFLARTCYKVFKLGEKSLMGRISLGINFVNYYIICLLYFSSIRTALKLKLVVNIGPKHQYSKKIMGLCTIHTCLNYQSSIDGATECIAPHCPSDPVPSGPSAKLTKCLATECPMVPECLVTQFLSKGPPLGFFIFFFRFY